MTRKTPKPNTSSTDLDRHRSSIQSVRRAVSLLKAFEPNRPELGVSELSRAVGLHKTTVYRLLVTLKEEGFVQHNPANDRYRLGPSLIRVGRIALDSVDLSKQAMPHMRALVDEVGETAMLEIWDDRRTLVVATVDGPRFTHIIARAGYHLPAHGSSGGKAMLAFLPSEEVDKVLARELKKYTENTFTDPGRLREELAQIRATGVSYDRQEIDIGVCAISVPIFDHRGEIAGALTVAGPMQRIPQGEDSALRQLVKKAGEAISRELGYLAK